MNQNTNTDNTAGAVDPAATCSASSGDETITNLENIIRRLGENDKRTRLTLLQCGELQPSGFPDALSAAHGMLRKYRAIVEECELLRKERDSARSSLHNNPADQRD